MLCYVMLCIILFIHGVIVAATIGATLSHQAIVGLGASRATVAPTVAATNNDRPVYTLHIWHTVYMSVV